MEVKVVVYVLMDVTVTVEVLAVYVVVLAAMVEKPPKTVCKFDSVSLWTPAR